MDLTLTSEEEAFATRFAAGWGTTTRVPSRTARRRSSSSGATGSRRCTRPAGPASRGPRSTAAAGRRSSSRRSSARRWHARRRPRPRTSSGFSWAAPLSSRTERRTRRSASWSRSSRRPRLVPGVLRARVRIRPGLAQDQGGTWRTAVGGSAGRRSGPPTRTRPSGACLLARTRLGRAEAQGPHVLHLRHGAGRGRGPAAPPDHGRGGVQRDLLRRRPCGTTRTWSAVRATAGWSHHDADARARRARRRVRDLGATRPRRAHRP